MPYFPLFFYSFFDFFSSRYRLQLENLALRQQVIVLSRPNKQHNLTFIDRAFWVCLSRLFTGWKGCLLFVQPDTVIKWHRQLFKYLWRIKSKPGRKPVSAQVRNLIKQMLIENTGWGAWKIYIELCLLGYYDNISLSTVKNYLKRFGPRLKTDPRLIKNWLAFLRNHSQEIASIDFGTVITASFKRIYFFIVLSNGRRKITHFNVSEQPLQPWVIQQMKEAFPYGSSPKYLIRDNDPVFGNDFNHIIKTVIGIKQIKTSPYSP